MMRLIALAIAGFSSSLCADVKLPALISDNMVLQAGDRTRIYGWADPGEKVSVTFQQQTHETQADDDGRWNLFIATRPTPEPVELIVEGNNRLVVRNVLVGEVWYNAGQSNMWWPTSRTTNATQELAAASYPRLRLFTVPVRTDLQPVDDITLDFTAPKDPPPEPGIRGRWIECSPDVVGDFSAVAYYFGRDLHRDLDRPVGVISAAVGGTIVEAWTSEATLSADPNLKWIVDHWQNYMANEYPKKLQQYQTDLAAYEKAAAAAGEAREKLKEPAPPIDAPRYVNRSSALYNGMVAPVTPYTIRGITWYQGESNASAPVRYEGNLVAMIGDWRSAWGIADLPFIVVQLPNLDTTKYTSLGKDWQLMREAQRKAVETANAQMIVTIDIGDSNDAHPYAKQPVARRLANVAEHVAYGMKDVPWTGPVFASARREGRAMRLAFTHADGGLVARGGELKSFELAGRDGVFHPASAIIDGDTVVATADKVPDPQAVRYAWSNTPEVTLYGANDLPAGPFAGGDMNFRKAFTGTFDGVPAGFWGSSSPEGWSSSDAARTYTTAVGFVQIPPAVILTGTTNRTLSAGDRFTVTADLGADEESSIELRLVATERSDRSGKKVILGKIEKPGAGRYSFDAATFSTPATENSIEGYTLFIEVETRHAGLGFFDNVTLDTREN